MTRADRTKRRASVCAIAAFATLCTAVLPAQQGLARDTASTTAPIGTAVLAGTIVSDEPGSPPVRHATVAISGSELIGGRSTVTDDLGTFAFAGLPAGRFTLTTTKQGWIRAAYGAKRPEGLGSAISVTGGQRITNIAMTMLRGAVITGVIRDANGDPAPDVTVQILRYQYAFQTGERTLAAVRSGPGERSDDRGRYRVFGLPPGDYLVMATTGDSVGRRSNDAHQVTAAEVQWATRQMSSQQDPSDVVPAPAPNVVNAPVYFPGTPVQASAATITLAAGEERSSVDFPLILVPTSRVTGTITSVAGAVPPNVRVNLIAQDRIEGIPLNALIDAPSVVDGKFVTTGIAPGTYTLTARASGPAPGSPGPANGLASDPATAALFAVADVTVSGDETDVALTLQSGASVSGRVAFEGTTLKPPADFTKMRVAMTAIVSGKSATIGVSPVNVDANGAFRFTGVAPGRYQFAATAPGSTPTAGWQPKTAIVNGHDSFDVPFEVRADGVADAVLTFTDRPSSISGAIQDAAGHPAPDYYIVVFPTDRAFWGPRSRRVQAKRPSSDGKFDFPNLPPGEYFIAATTDIEQGQWFDPAFLATLAPLSIKLLLGEGEKKVQDIKIGG